MTAAPTTRTRVHAFTDDALGEHDTLGLQAELRAGRVGVAEVVDAAIARAEAVDPELAALASERFELARADAQRPGAGFFSGIPTFIKDNTDLAGLPTQQGTTAYVGTPKPRDGDFARMFKATGVIPLGKTRLSEFGFSGAAEFVDERPVHNPWHTGHTSGASSAGSAALVAAGVVPISHANDGGGSIRIPAACCGLVGLKPTRNRVISDRLTRDMPLRIVSDGVVTRTVRDTAAFLREAEQVYCVRSLPPVGDVHAPGAARLRIALIVDSVGDRAADHETREVVLGVGKDLESAGHTVELVDAPVPEYFADDFLNYWSTLALYLLTTGKRTLGPTFDRHRTDNLSQGLARHALHNLPRLPLALSRLWASQFVSRRFLTTYDVALTPVLGHVTPRLGHLHPAQEYEQLLANLLDWVSFTPLQNASGDPAISLPAGTSATGLPIGIQFAARQGRDAMLLGLAYEFEAMRPFPRIQGGFKADCMKTNDAFAKVILRT